MKNFFLCVKEENEKIGDLNLTTPSKINLIIKILRSSPAVEQYFNGFRDFFTDNEKPKDVNKKS